MRSCWEWRAEDRPNFDTVFSLLQEIHSQYPPIQNMAPPTAAAAPTTTPTNTSPEEISYSTFGKDLRSHDAPPLETAAVSLRSSSIHRRMRSGGATGGSLRGSVSRGSPANSQRNSMRNSQNLLSVDSMSGAGGERLSITFSVLSQDLDMGESSESEVEENKGLPFEIPSFLIGGTEGGGMVGAGEDIPLQRRDPYAAAAPPTGPSPGSTPVPRTGAETESPMDLVSTFLGGGGKRASRPTSYDYTDYHTTSTFMPPVTTPTPAPPPSQATPPNNTTTTIPGVMLRSSRDATPPAASGRSSGQVGGLAGQGIAGQGLAGQVVGPPHNKNNNHILSPSPPVSDATPTSPPTSPPAVSVTPHTEPPFSADTTPTPTTPALDTPASSYSPGGQPHPPSHIPGLPASTFNNTSVSIDDVKLRNTGSLLDANTHATKSVSVVSTTPSGASKSDSGIRSDEEVESVLSNGVSSSSEARMPLTNKKTSIGSAGKKDSDISLGISDLSSDLMATFASWGKS